MAILEIGRVCVKKAGRKSGEKVVVVEDAKDGFVTVEGVTMKKKRCNVLHLIPTGQTINVGTREQWLKALGEK